MTFDPTKISPNSFEVSWFEPIENTEFDQYQVAIGIRRKTPQIIERGAPLTAKFTENLKPGRTYQVHMLLFNQYQKKCTIYVPNF